MTSDNSEAGSAPQLTLQKIYVKDLSFESPHAAALFSKTNSVSPEINMQMSAESQKISDTLYEIVLNITITAKEPEQDTNFYLLELKQAGLFTLQNFPQNDLNGMINSFCPNILFPYAREAISNMVERGGYPQLLLAPINFDALYQHVAKLQSAAAEEAASELKH